MIWVLVILASVILIGAFTGFVIYNNKQQQKKRLLVTVQGKSALNDMKKAKINAQDQRRSDLAKKLKEEEKEKETNKVSLPDMIMQAGMEITVMQFWIFSIVSGVFFFILTSLMGMGLFVKIMITLFGFLGLPRFVLKFKTARRQKKFMEDMPDALESMQRLLKAGMPVSEAIKMVGEEFTGPMGDEMGRVFDQQKIGVPLPEACLNMTKRMPLTEVQMFATAIAIQTQTGSSLSEVLENLAGVIRARFKLRRKVKALSSEAKASAGIIGALPVFVASSIYFLNREYIEILFYDPTGKMLLTGAIVWMMIGIFVMRQMINFKI
ncbi:MAG: type II secretion system F family protein [Pseudomonadota bacterium]